VVSAPVTLRVPMVAQPNHRVATGARLRALARAMFPRPRPTARPLAEYIAPLLGYGYAITNCGASGTTMMKNGNAPYWNTGNSGTATNSSPDIVISMLGSNDSKPANWINQTNYDSRFYKR